MPQRSPAALWYGLLYRLERLRRRERTNRYWRDVQAEFDQAAFIERFRPYWNPFRTVESNKFLNLEVWLAEAVERAFHFGLDRPPAGRRVLDIGSGAGYFLHVCRRLGHDVIGMDLDTDSLYNEMFDFLKLPRITHRIVAGRPLPDIGAPLDLATAFMTCFNRRDDGSAWTGDDWRCFLADLRTHMNPGGVVIVRFNLHPDTGLPYPAELPRAVNSLSGFKAHFPPKHMLLNVC
jgi:SAM-dependent methyltransferase